MILLSVVYIQTAYPLRTGPMMAEWYRVVHTSRPAGRSSAVLACHANRALISRARRVSGQIRVVVSHAIWGYQIRWQIGYSSRSFLDVHPPDHRTSEDRPFQRPLLNTYYGYLGKQWEQLERRSSMVCMQYDQRSIPPRIPPNNRETIFSCVSREQRNERNIVCRQRIKGP